jgi:hypothetical protein
MVKSLASPTDDVALASPTDDVELDEYLGWKTIFSILGRP